jgi:hypothetical protein
VAEIANGDISGYIAGAKENMTFDIQVSLKNTAYNTIASDNDSPSNTTCDNWQMYVVCELESKLILDNTSAVIVSGLSKAEIKQALATTQVSEVADVSGLAASGGSFKGFLRGLKKIASKVLPLVGLATSFRNPVLGMAMSGIGSALNGEQSASSAVRGLGAQGLLTNPIQALKDGNTMSQPAGAGLKLRG